MLFNYWQTGFTVSVYAPLKIISLTEDTPYS